MSNEDYFKDNMWGAFASSVGSFGLYLKDKVDTYLLEQEHIRDDINDYKVGQILNGLFTQNQTGGGIAPTDSTDKIFRVRFLETSPNGEVFSTPTSWIPDPFKMESGATRDAMILMHPECRPEGPAEGYDIAAGDMLKVYRRDDTYIYTKIFYKEEYMAQWMANIQAMQAAGASAANAFANTSNPLSTLSNVTSAPTNDLINSVGPEDFVLLFGDSQMQGSTKGGLTLGATIEKNFKNVKRVGNGGKTASWYAQNVNFNSQIKAHLAKNPKLIVIILGGNGVDGVDKPKGDPKRAKGAKSLLQKIKGLATTSKIIWIGPPPPATDGTTYNKDGSLHGPRWAKNKALQEEIGSFVDTFIDPYSIGEFGKGYSCKGTCDGVHLPGEFAKTFAAQAGLLGEVQKMVYDVEKLAGGIF